ncbi:MAG: DUF3854 domain-containing protein [Chloroflexota bacterium]|nr:MAG: hypothetical protein DLM70_18525 [Chloroflexota bacterium]
MSDLPNATAAQTLAIGLQGAPVTWDDLDLAPQHVAVLEARGIKPDVAKARAVFTATSRKCLEILGFAPNQRSVPAMAIPILNTRGARVTYQTRPDEPRERDGKCVKYETMAGSRVALDVPPHARSLLRDMDTALWVTEGPLKADSAVSQGLCCVALLGVWSFARQKEVLDEWDDVPLDGRPVFIAFDSDIVGKPQVRGALRGLKNFLERRGAKVRIITLPAGSDSEKTGLDDYLASGGGVDVLVEAASSDLPEPELGMESGPYRQTKGGIFFDKPGRDGPTPVPLTNFPARILAEETLDDGSGELLSRYEIEAMVRGRNRQVTVPASQFAGMGWVSQLGVRAILYANYGARDHARVAIQRFSAEAQERHIYTHTGWREIEGRNVFLTGAGGITSNGLLPDIDVSLDGDAASYALPEPGASTELCKAVRASLAIVRVARPRVSIPLLGGVYRAPLGAVDTSIHLYGETGTFKTELAALCQQHFGAKMDARHLPCHWGSTDNALEAVLHQTKDVLAVVDEYVSAPDPGSRFALQRKGDRIFRAVGNQTGRQRCRSDGSTRVGKPPRCLVLSTGEDRPLGQSLGARRVDIHVDPGEVDPSILSECQRKAKEGAYALAMAGYLQWLAGKRDAGESELAVEPEVLQFRGVSDELHRRTPYALANLSSGWRTFLNFARDIGAITQEEYDGQFAMLRETLLDLARDQHDLQDDVDPTSRFFSLLSSAISTGQAHVASVAGSEPDDPRAWGWAPLPDPSWRPGGHRVGWVSGSDLYLDPQEAYATANRLASATEEPLGVSKKELYHRLDQKGLLISKESNRQRRTIRLRVQGQSIPVLHLKVKTLFPGGQDNANVTDTGSSRDPDGGSGGKGDSAFASGGPAPATPAAPNGDHDTTSGGRQRQMGKPGLPMQKQRETIIACANERHAGNVRCGLDRQYICNVCHPPPRAS